MGVARLSNSPFSEAKIMPECEACTRLSADTGHSSSASSSAAVLTTRCWASERTHVEIVEAARRRQARMLRTPRDVLEPGSGSPWG